MTEPAAGQVTSADGTTIAFDRSGAGRHRAVAAAIPGAVHRVLPGQSHNPTPEALVPELLEFFAS